MRTEDMIIVSVDDHVVEPPDLFERHLPAKYRDVAPRVIHKDDGTDVWQFLEFEVPNIGLNAVAGRPPEEYGIDPTSFDEIREGCFDIEKRILDMNANGVLGSLNFPSLPGFAGRLFAALDDKEAALALAQAYNDWHIDEWCGTYPDRFIPLAIPPIWDPQVVADEVRRVAAKGCRAVTMPELPHIQGLPSYINLDYWDPFFRAVSEEEVVMCLHIGQGFNAIKSAPEAPIDNLIILATQVSAIAAQDLLWGGAFRAYPDLKVAWSEAGIGWIPFYLDRCDRHYKNQRWLGHDFGDKLPSDIFRDHSLACYVTDPISLKVRHEIGIDIIAWECDYPHSDSIWPDAPETVLAELDGAGASDDDIHQITWENSCRHFGYDPFKHIDRTSANVGALRALSPDVDTSTKTRAEWRELYEKAHAGAR
ncbi:MAG TPA: amidohydrolase family protein [Acidimicrobiia bacterium]|nr:amidohydrolase family protein [Acidimicrobiia bacterium]